MKSIAASLILLATLLPAGASESAPEAPLSTIVWVSRGLRLEPWTYVKERLPKIEHQVVPGNSKRVLQELREGQHVCVAHFLMTPERESQVYFTPFGIAPPGVVVVRADRKQALPLDGDGEVQLPRLLADAGLRGGLIEGRSLGAELDPLLTGPQAGAVSRIAPTDGTVLLRMVQLGRLDYAFDHAANIVLYQSQASTPPESATPPAERLVPVTIDGLDHMTLNGFACSRTPQGLAAIRQIDAVLATHEAAQYLLRVHLAWVGPVAAQRYRRDFEAFFRQRARPWHIR